MPELLSAKVLHASTVGQGQHSRSEASVAEANLTVGGNTIAAGFLMSRATAACSGSRPSVTGSSDVLPLVVNGQTVAVTGAPNQTVVLPNGQVVINEQMATEDSITVNALHVTVNGIADVILASAHADIHCAGGKGSCPSDKDFVAGGGRISPPKRTFGVAGGMKNGGFWGHLTYIDHHSGLKVKGTGVTAYSATGETRHIEGTAEANGTPVTYSVDVADNGEPGRSDTFNLTLSNGYTAGGTLAGGNIQLHACR